MKLPNSFVDKTDLLNVIIETPQNSPIKYTFDPETQFFKLTKILPFGMIFPLHFGFIPGTKGEDGDPLDVLVLMDEPTFPGCFLECKVIGIIEAKQKEKRKTFRNDRILAKAVESRKYTSVKSFEDIDRHVLEDVINFFITYNEIAGKKFTPLGNKSSTHALKLIRESMI